MLFVKFLELFALLCVALFILTQVLIPARQDKKLFPAFRKTGKLEAELVEANTAIGDAELAKKVVEAKTKVDIQL